MVLAALLLAVARAEPEASAAPAGPRVPRQVPAVPGLAPVKPVLVSVLTWEPAWVWALVWVVWAPA